MPEQNPNARRLVVCKGCKEKKEHHSKEMCFNCYRRLSWKPREIVCKRCQKTKPHHARGYCNSCHNVVYHYDKIKEYNARKYHNISLEKYRSLTKKCVLCGFDKVTDLHHLDGDHKNNKSSNLVGLCPNHHKMYHTPDWKEEVTNLLKKKGYL